MIRILGAQSPGELRVALLNGGALEDYTVWRPGAPDGLGDVYSARIIAYVPAMAGAFVALPAAEGFLPDTRGAEKRAEGDAVIVRVVRTAQGGKGPRLALVPDALPTPPGLLVRGESPLHRLARMHPAAEVVVDDPGLARAFPGRARVVPDAFDDALEAEIAALSAAWADLPGGLRAGFFPTPALTAIDLDGAGTTARRGTKDSVQFAANRDALPALARQIRLRNLSGAILIDFAGLPVKKRASLGGALSAALSDDPLQPRLLGFTQLGLAELSRARTTAPLHETLSGPHAAGLAALRDLARALRHAPSPHPALRAAPAVVRALESDASALAAFAALSTYKLILRSDPTLPACAWLDEST